MALIDDIVSYYKLDDNLATTNVIDSVGANNGTLSGGDNTDDLSVAGKIGTGLDFNGTDDKVILANENNFDFDDELTISAWIKTSTIKEDFIFAKGKGGDFQYVLGLGGGATNSVRLIAWTSAGGNYLVITGTTDVADGAWHHIVGVIKNTAYAKIYVDGVYEAVDSTPSGTWDTSGAAAAIIGNSEIHSWWFDGVIDELGVWEKVLTDGGVAVTETAGGEIAELYNLGDGLTYPFEAPVGTNTQINIGDAWKEISAMKINIGDAWKEVASAQINIGDSWKSIF